MVPVQCNQLAPLPVLRLARGRQQPNHPIKQVAKVSMFRHSTARQKIVLQKRKRFHTRIRQIKQGQIAKIVEDVALCVALKADAAPKLAF